ncbi:hypothetical protein [Desulfosporosinus sp. I2]|uniref:hypothetical protein n=1 Tax=Desulfosporosinus sp. I2 TaxID=1617025 RepID=UPI0018CFE662|nr:hypothetical protein [Desulfosporosinus sp. I2]
MGSKTVQVKGGCTRRFTAAGNTDRLGLLASNSRCSSGGCKLGKVHFLGGCDYTILAKTCIL